MSTKGFLWPLAIVLGFFLPMIFGGSHLVYNTFVVIAIFAVVAYGVDIVLSDLGEVSLAHTVFFAAGAYTVGVLAVRYGMPIFVTLPAAMIVAMMIAGLLGAITFRVQGFVFSLVTYAASIVCLNIAENWHFLGSSDGIVGVPPLEVSLGPFRYTADTNEAIWPIAYVMLVLVIYFIGRFRRSDLGRAAHMVHLNDRLATMSGHAPRRIRFGVFMVSAVVTSLGGWLYSYQRFYVGPDLFQTYFLILMLTATVLPGKRVLLGPLMGTAILMCQSAFLSGGGYVDKLFLGTVLVIILAFYPKGLIGAWDTMRSFFERSRSEKTGEVTNPRP